MAEYEKLDKKNRSLLEILKKDSRTPYSTLGKRLGMVRETVYYRMLNLEKRGIIRKYVTFVNISHLGLEAYAVFLSLHNADGEEKGKAIAALDASPAVAWVASLGGDYDLVFSIHAENGIAFKRMYQSAVGPFQASIKDCVFSHRVFISVSEERESGKSMVLYSGADKVAFDGLDRNILDLLKDDSRMSLVEMAKRIRVPATTIQSRIKRLEQQNTITGYGIIVDYTRLGYQIFQLLLTTSSLEKREYAKLKEYCTDHPAISFFVDTIAPWTYELTATVHDLQELQAILDDLKRLLKLKLQGTRAVLTFNYWNKIKTVADQYVKR